MSGVRIPSRPLPRDGTKNPFERTEDSFFQMGSRFLLLAAVAVMLGTSTAGCVFDRSPFQSAPYDFIRDDPYGALFIEIDHVAGEAPHSSATSLLQQRAGERLSKPDGMTVETSSFDGGRDAWSVDDLKAAEDKNRDQRPGGNTMVLYVLYVDGEFEENSGVIGIHYGSTSVAIFKERIRSGSFTGPLGLSVAEAEQAVLVHEFGHAIGLVNRGIPMVEDHEDDEHPGHSDNSDSVMYWRVETSEIGLITGGPSNQFDAQDIADIRAAGGK